jgi:small-conductance mechanosensitive channel
MPTSSLLLVAAFAFLTLAAGRALHSKVVRRLAGGLVFVLVATLAEWAVALGHLPERWSTYADVALLLAVGYLITRVTMLLFFDWLLARRMAVNVPRLARDVLTLVIYLVVVAVILRTTLNLNVATLVTTSAVITVVVGFALQETLGTLLAGLALAWEQRLTAGTWVEVEGVVGEIEELGWRSLVLRTLLGEQIMLPNSQIARTRVRFLGDGDQTVAVVVKVGVGYGAAPHAVKRVLAEAAKELPLVLDDPSPQMFAKEFGDSAVIYECRLWTRMAWRVPEITDSFLTRAHAALARAGMEIPFPQRTVHVAPRTKTDDRAGTARKALAACELFAGLPDDALNVLATTAHWLVFAPEEAVVREGEASSALYVIAHGGAVVRRGGQDLARIGAGEVFGEMAFLSGAPRAATVYADGDLAVVEVDSNALGTLLVDHRSLAAELANRMALRQQAIEAQSELLAGDTARRGLAGFLLDRLLHLVAG